MYDTPATERSATVDERAEVSFSFDGKEVSVSLYETPDLTEEEALQVVEMYADQLSEHVSGEISSHRQKCLQQFFFSMGTCLMSFYLATIRGCRDRPTDSQTRHGLYRNDGYKISYIVCVHSCKNVIAEPFPSTKRMDFN
jgi:hypothetical protein